MAYPDFAYDIFENFENALVFPWTENDVDSNINISTAKYFAGTHSLEIDPIGATAGVDAGYNVVAQCASTKTKCSFNVWFRTPDNSGMSGGTVTFPFITVSELDTGGNYLIKIYIHYNWDGVLSIRMRGAGGAYTDLMPVSYNTWYCMKIYVEKNATSRIRIYDSTDIIVGTEKTVTAYNYNINYLFLGCISTEYLSWSDSTQKLYLDNFVCDYTLCTYPLNGIETISESSIDLKNKIINGDSQATIINGNSRRTIINGISYNTVITGDSYKTYINGA